MDKIIWGFEKQTNLLISARKQNLAKKKKKKKKKKEFVVWWILPFQRTTKQKIKENEKKRQVIRPCQRTKKAVEHEGDSNINYNWCRGVMVIVVGNGLGNSSSKPGRDWMHFT